MMKWKIGEVMRELSDLRIFNFDVQLFMCCPLHNFLLGERIALNKRKIIPFVYWRKISFSSVFFLFNNFVWPLWYFSTSTIDANEKYNETRVVQHKIHVFISNHCIEHEPKSTLQPFRELQFSFSDRCSRSIISRIRKGLSCAVEEIYI